MTRSTKTVALPHHRARRLRRDQTDAEKKLWGRLRAKRLADFHFRRQFPIGNFIADFACPKSKLVIELDGGQHLDQKAKDDWRTKLIEQRGFRVLRFWDSEVLTGIDGVLEGIMKALSES
ncbi:endonuclease domain-containing protein [Candidatus Binatus sp.]|uniref:endonuclease domain-containing protein n=1 Tax=Candidatus Binatus sp. TaxID=2811406 RepID=UPI003CC5A774